MGGLAVVCSAHGFGHLTRQLALVPHLQALGPTTLIHPAPTSLITARNPHVHHLPLAVDVGIAQTDSLTERLDLTAQLLAERASEDSIDALAGHLASYDAVLVDIAPTALEAARRAGTPTLAIGNFDWASIYAHYPELTEWRERFRAWQRPHTAIQLGPGMPLQDFSHVLPGGLLTPPYTPPASGLPHPFGLVSFGGFGLDNLSEKLPIIPGFTWVFSAPAVAPNRPDCLQVDGLPYPSLLAAADLVLTKPGYGIISECAAHGTPMLWVDRGAFPEAPHLEAWLSVRGDTRVHPFNREAVTEGILRMQPGLRHPLVAGDTRRMAQQILDHFGA